MSFDLNGLRNALEFGPVVRVVLADARGSVPRGAGTSMLVGANRQWGTIGGGALEFEATRRARAMLAAQSPWEAWSLPLGPSLGQCCGGAVSILAERFETAPEPEQFPRARPVLAPDGVMPLQVEKARQAATKPLMVAGWFIEPLDRVDQSLWIWGAGHVGRALVDVLAPYPSVSLTWIDDAACRFPDAPAPAVQCLPAPDMPAAMALAPLDAHHLILTYSHDIDLALCHAALHRGFASCGLIGSATKWARFQTRLQALGHAPAQIARIDCPIGMPELGKHPHAIAIGVAARHLQSWGSRSLATAQTKVG
ncbi:MAG: xanthine dehydrogenase accessory protein XdhC [Pseudomonadota bacterium]